MDDKKKQNAKKDKEKTEPKVKQETLKKQRTDFVDTLGYQIWPVVLAVLAIGLLFIYLFPSFAGTVGPFLRDVLFGTLSWGAILIPAALIKQVITWKSDVEKKALTGNFIYYGVTVLLVSILAHAVTLLVGKLSGVTVLAELYENGKHLVGGGAIGGWLGAVLASGIGPVITFLISFTALSVFIVFAIGLTPVKLAGIVAEKAREKREERKLAAAQHREENRQKRIEEENRKKQAETEAQKKAEEEEKKKRRAAISDIDVTTDDDGVIVETPDDIPLPEPPEPTPDPVKNTVRSDIDADLDLEEIFVNKENLELTKKMFENTSDDGADNVEAELDIDSEKLPPQLTEPPVISTENAFDEPEKVKEYQFPPISFLTKDNTVVKNDTEDLNLTAEKLVHTLESFGVKTTVVNVSKGPTVTRYELQPQIGVKVRAIGNLVDDIALHLAAVGAVRIEAPIPGKSAVGIEVPNQRGSIVRLRELIENDKFSDSKSKVTCALGGDVAGNPIYMNVAAMPHLLIAGATGMGKSVCINSLIISILYKATPEEVKLILIDPKKVELNIYNGIPHLIVPVVSDPKKAAGSLRWAVSEMERRFQIIEECGARDIAGYNEVADTDPDMEKLPQIVIIIDELADLMMTAPGDVEDTICRLAQKARAAGMHLIIGTQRPSVDVITGLIKANIPSRIAFTVASQVDSRTIIDIAGAEKLCGKGDMLYAPVGMSKPLRVQGAFVSTAEVEHVCEFLKNTSDTVYDDDVAKTIEQEAAKCGLKGKEKSAAEAEGAGEADTSDEMLPKAIELAVEAGANGISTSMLQRRLAVGYARAGRLIDTMEHMGVVGGFEGSKPRKVLITREQFLEMRLGDNGQPKQLSFEEVPADDI